MRNPETSHFQALTRIVTDKEKKRVGGIATTILSPLTVRTDDISVFEEAKKFSGLETRGMAEAGITITASPHVTPVIPRELFTSAATRVLEREPEIPNDIEMLSPQVIIWWRKKDDLSEGTTDFRTIASLPDVEQQNFAETIGIQTDKGIRIVSQMAGKPTLWGAWGHGTPEERMQIGKSRGGPTNRHGHLHITHFNEEEQVVALNDNLTATEKLNHYGPWNRLIHSELSAPIADVLQRQINDFLGIDKQCKVTPVKSEIIHENKAVSYQDGYEAEFEKPLPLADIFAIMIKLAGIYEDFYQTLSMLHETYHRNIHTELVTTSVKGAMDRYIQSYGFSASDSLHLVQFALRIKPTYGQLRKWSDEAQVDQGEGIAGQDQNTAYLAAEQQRYEHFLQLLNERNNTSSLRIALIKDAVKPPEQYKTIDRTWPVHSGFAFLIDDFEIGEEILVSKMRLLHEVATTGNGGEKILGTVLKRE